MAARAREREGGVLAAAAIAADSAGRAHPLPSLPSQLARLRPTAPVRPTPAARPLAARPQALFGGLFGGGGKKESGAAADIKICVDCGWITDDYSRGMSCPVCKSKSFKAFKGAVKAGGRLDNSPKAMQARFKARQW